MPFVRSSSFASKSAGFVFVLLTCALLALNPPCSRGAMADGANAVFLTVSSLFFRAVLMTVFCLHRGERPFARRGGRKLVVLGGLLQAVTGLSLYLALTSLPGPIVWIILYTFPLILLMFQVWRREMRFSTETLVLTLSALAGLSLVLDVWHATLTDWAAVGLSAVAAVATAARTYIYGHLVTTKSPALVGAENFIAAFVFALAFLVWQRPVLPQSLAGYGWISLVYLGSVLGSFGIFYGIRLVGTFSWGLLAKMEPVFVALFSALLLGEVLSFTQYLGIATVMASLVFYQLRSEARPPSQAEPELAVE